MTSKLSLLFAAAFALAGTAQLPARAAQASITSNILLNVSYDPTREFYAEFNAAFVKHWEAEGGKKAVVRMSHGGSGKQARSVIDGLEADVVTLALASDIDAIAETSGRLPADWQRRLPDHSAPCTSTIVFLVRQGNPKQIRDWDDLVKPGIQVITPNPKTSGGARWNYLAAWGYALKREGKAREQAGQPANPGQDEAKAQAFVKALFANVIALDSGARGATTSFILRKQGDVLLTWESEAFQTQAQFKAAGIEIVYPSASILAEPPVAIIDKNVDKHGSRKLAEAYLGYLYSPEGQEIAARHFYRPRLPEVAAKYQAKFTPIPLFTIDELFGGWTQAQKTHFADGGSFDQIQPATKAVKENR